MDYESDSLPSMIESVRMAVENADHLVESDGASVDLALHLATIIDDARASGDPDAINKTSFGPMPSLHKVLTALGLNPEGREKLGLNDVEPADDDF